MGHTAEGDDVSDEERPSPAAVEAAVEVLRAAGWHVHQSVGYGRLVGDLLVSHYMGDGQRHVATSARETWRQEDES